MNTNIHVKNKLKATFFLVVLSSFYVISILCNSGLKNVLFPKKHDHSSHSHAHGGHSHGSSHHSVKKKPDTKKPVKDNCCKESTLAFFASLKSSKLFNIEIKPLYEVSPLFIVSEPSLEYNSQELTPLRIQFFRPKVPDVRIFIQSFII